MKWRNTRIRGMQRFAINVAQYVVKVSIKTMNWKHTWKVILSQKDSTAPNVGKNLYWNGGLGSTWVYINIVTILTIRNLALLNCLAANLCMTNLQPVNSKTVLIPSVHSDTRWIVLRKIISEYKKNIDKLMDEIEIENNFDKMKSSSFKTSTPKRKTEKMRDDCEDCNNGILLFLLLRSPCKKLKSYNTPLYHFSNGGNKN